MQALNTVKMSDLRKNTEEVIEEIQNSSEAFTLISRSKPIMVMMSIVAYKKLKADEIDHVDWAAYSEAMDFFQNFSKTNSTKGVKVNAVDLVRNERR